MTGSSIFDYVHQADHAEMAEQLGLSLTGSGSGRGGSTGGGLHSPASGASEEGSQQGTNNPDVSAQMTLAASSSLFKGMDRAFCIRMKSTLTKRGCHFKSSGYRVVLILSRLRPQYSFSHSRKSAPALLGMVALAIALPPPSVHEIRLECDMFVTRINFDFRIAHCEPRVSELLGYTAEEMTGKNLYALCHGEDANKLKKCHIDLMNKGQVLTHYYRIMNKHGGYTWVQTCATVVCSSKNADEQNVICVNYVISGREYPNTIMDCCQLEESVQGVKHEESNGDPENGSPDADKSSDASRSGLPGPLPPRCSPKPNEKNDSPENGNERSNDVTQLSQSNPSPDQPQSLVVPVNKNPKVSVEETPPIRKGKKRKLVQTEEDNNNIPKENGESICLEKVQKVLSTNMRGILSPTNPTGTQQNSSHDISSKTNLLPEVATDSTSVKDLENAMSKHLPSAALNVKDTAPSQQPTDFSTDTLLKQQQQKSTIQWIGAQNHLSHLNQQLQHGHSAVASMPASALLRQLYVNRESVIRTNVLGITSGSSRVGSAGGYYSNEGQVGPLPTPPGSEGSSNYGDHQFINLHNQKANGDAFSNLVSSYGSSGAYAMDYHSAMTPPSSVSPRDKQQTYAHSGVPFDNSVYTDVLRHSYLGANNESPAQPLPLKPQVYSAMHGALDYASSTLDQSQFFSHGTPTSGFHLYHPSTNKGGPPSNWYSTTS